MHQTAKRKQWYLGVKAHIGVESATKLVHTVLASAANVAEKDALPYLLHGNETRLSGDSVYQGQTEVIHARSRNASGCTNHRCRYREIVDEIETAKNRSKSQVRAKVEHVFAVIKGVFGFRKVRYRGLDKNLNRLEATCALANLFMVRRQLQKT